MADVSYALAQLTDALRETKEYAAYQRAKEKVNQFPELKAQIDEFRIRNFEIQNLTIEHDKELYYEVEAFEKEYESFRENPLVEAFLSAELGFCRMLQGVNAHLVAELDFE